jgi:hypothetical protein
MTKQNGFIGILAVVLIALFAGIGGYLIVTKNKKTETTPLSSSKIPTTESTPLAQVSNTTGVLTPTATFIKFRTEFDATTTFDAALATSIRYATKAKAASFSSQSLQVTPEMKASLFPSLKLMVPPISAVTVVSENINGDTATLSLKNNTNPKETGTVTLQKESGVWKIEGENWKGLSL